MNVETKYNVASCLVWTSIIACTLSLIAIFMAYPIKSCCRPDANSVAVDILAILVTVLMGWNIYSVIDTKSEVNKLKEEREKLQEYVKANRNYAIGVTNLTNQKYGTAIGFLCSAAVKANKILDKEMLNDCLGMIKDTIDEQKDHMDDISYLDSFMRLIRDDLRGIKDERIDFISKSIEDIISSQEKKTQEQNKQ